MTTNNRHPATAPPPCLSLDDSFLMASPGPMTLVSNFFSGDSFDCRSFSELLAGAMASPVAGDDDDGGSHKNVVNGGGFKQSRPMNLIVARSPVFTVPPGLSPSCFLNSPTFCFSPQQSPFGMSHQQAVAQITAQAVLTQPHMQMQAAPNFTLNDASEQKEAPSEPVSAKLEASELSHAEKKYQLSSSSLVIDKPAYDGYNWRKYGQKQVKGSDYPRSYYKCTHLNCTVTKKVERGAADIGRITEIIYKGQHNHEKPQGNHKRVKDYNNDLNENASIETKSEYSNSQGWFGNSNKLGESLSDCSVPEVESEDTGDVDVREEEEGDREPDPKRRNTDLGVSGGPFIHKTVTEAKIIVQTRSQVDLLDDGYRWRKYGQKVVKCNPHPRSYYKCTSVGCNVRKHIERASMDPKAVVTTYEGKHNHDVPAAKNSNSMSLKPHKVVPEKHSLLKDMDNGNNSQRPVQLCLEEEQIIA